MAEPSVEAPGLIPYDVASPLWSDGAEKSRFFALPASSAIGLEPGGGTVDEGHFDMPVGTIMVKTFTVAGKRIETRLLTRLGPQAWAGYVYAWRADQSDADLLPDAINGTTRTLDNGQSWYFPSRGDCFACHTPAAGVTLGLERWQLDHDFAYRARSSNQLDTLAHIGVLTIPTSPSLTIPKRDDQSQPIEARARGLLHANCSFCHRLGSTMADLDLRFDTPLQRTSTCNATPERGGAPDDKRIAPGLPDHSVLLTRMKSTTIDRMPPIATSVVDTEGTTIISTWIQSLTSCP